MTTPREELRALKRTRQLLSDLIAGPRMPQKVLKARARDCLHHWPLYIEGRYQDVKPEEDK